MRRQKNMFHIKQQDKTLEKKQNGDEQSTR